MLHAKYNSFSQSYQALGYSSNGLLTIIPDNRYNTYMVDIYSVNEAAQQLDLDPSQVRRLLRDKIIEGKKLGHDWVVFNLDYKKQKFGVGRKPKGDKK